MARLNFCLAGILSLLALGGIAPASAADRVALVVGNGAYQKVPMLPNPPRDAADVGAALERLNFKVTRLNNAGAAEMRKAIVDFGRATEGSEMAIVFYAGHGMEAGGENWLIPTDAELRSDTDVESEAVSLRSINLQVSKARQLGLVILDACRNNPFAAKMQRSLRTRAVARGLAPTEPTDNVLVAYAARDGTTANDGDGRNSPFTTALLRNIETPGLEISFLFRNVRDEVMTATKREQQPFVYGSLSKEAIYLKPPVVAQPPAPAAPATVSATPAVVAKASPEPDVGKDRAAPPDEKKRNTFTDEDAKRIAAFGAAISLKMPPFAIGETKADVPDSYTQFVGVWSSKSGFGEGKGRKGMLIVTEVLSDGLALGYYLWGPPTKTSWTKAQAGYASLASKIDGGVLRFQSGELEARLSGPNAMTLKSKNLKKPSETSSIKFEPLWRLVPQNQIPQAKRFGDRSGEDSPPVRRMTHEALSSSSGDKPDAAGTQDPNQSTKALYAKCSAEGHRIAGGKHKNVGFSRIEACVRNGGQM